MIVFVETSYLKTEHVERLRQSFQDITFVTELSEASTAEVAIAMPGFIRPEHLEKMPKLTWIQLLTAGFNTVDLDDLRRRNIAVTYAKDVFSIQIAEDVFSKILHFNRGNKQFLEQQKASLWKNMRVSHEIFGSTVGIIGTGSIGTEVAIRMKAFGARVIGYNRSARIQSPYETIYTGKTGLYQLLSESDYVIISCPLSKETYHLIDSDAISHMKKDALLVNVARGEIIDQDALIDALKQGNIRGAGLDVTTPEPLPKESPLWTLDHVFITPHNASASPHVMERVIKEVEDALKRYLLNQPFDNLVKP